MTFLEMCKETNSDPKYWKQWLEENSDKETPKHELLGLLEEEYEDLKNNLRSIDFYILKRQYKRNINYLWSGCYVKFIYEMDLLNPHFEYGWVDIVSNEKGFCKIQCDDSYNGSRALTIRTIDIMEILPFKERPLIYYKTMICGDCNDCDRTSVELPPDTCKCFEFFNAILNKQKADTEFIKLYYNIKENNNNNVHSCNCHECNKNCKNSEENI